jgi:serine/threonine-protein kinase
VEVSSKSPRSGRVGQVLAERYELTAVLGHGGQSVVYRARDLVDGDEVAVKVLGRSDHDSSERMFREALAMSQLQGTAAVRVLHQAWTQDGALALIMELLDGEDLSTVLDRREAAGQRAETSWVVEIFDPIVATLEIAHERGIVHRDIKTENVFLVSPARGGGVRLLDFGLAKLVRAPTITGAEVVTGSPPYLAPEVWTLGSYIADPRTDVYSLGAVLYRVLGGRVPFDGTLLEVMHAACTKARPSLHALRPDLSPDVDDWVGQVLAIRPEDRFFKISAAWRSLKACF